MAKTTPKVYVLDTNVILHDSACLYQFEENDVVIPISVLEELDNFKKGNDTIHFHAREFLRNLDILSEGQLFNGGIKIGKGLGKVAVSLEQPFCKELLENFSSERTDHRILNTTLCYSKRFPKRQTILVTKDVNLRMKAKAVGLVAQDYRSDQIKDILNLYTGYRIIDAISDETVDRLYQSEASLPIAELASKESFIPNEYLIFKSSRKSGLARFDQESNSCVRVEKRDAYGITPRNAEQTFALNALLNDEIKLVSITGKAGTGKTLLALAAAIESKSQYRQIYVARPVIPLSNRDIGFLPGDINSKLEPYMQPLRDNLGVIQNQFSDTDPKYKKIAEMTEHEKLVIAPLAYIRGRSLVKIFFIVDEAQNLTPHEVKTIITRAGEGTKIVFTGDIFQIDHPYLDRLSNGLSYLIEKMHGQSIYAHIDLKRGERSYLAELASNLL
ncbi:MAG: PhoH family protein [Chitinivibrionales bacterium]|nr:PhoH family protein [Chitinivibrionales bacterium]